MYAKSKATNRNLPGGINMRLQLNLNQYYDCMDDYQVNQLFSLFVGIKLKITLLKKCIETCQTGEWYEYCKDVAFSGFGAIDVFMEELGKRPIFDTENILKKYNTDEMFYEEFDIEPLIEKYEYLMEKPTE